MNNSNDDKIKEYQRKKVLKYLIILLSIIVVVLEVLALFKVISMIWGLLLFIVIYILKKIFQSH